MEMQFDHLPPTTPYLAIVLDIIRKGIAKEKDNLKRNESEDIKNQKLSDVFNFIGTQNEKIWIGVNKENKKSILQTREDIYFYLEGDNHPRIFYVEGKRLPKAKTINDEEYVSSNCTSGKTTGGIERYKLGLHGEPKRLKYNGIIAYIENKTVAKWEKIINNSITFHFPEDTILKAEKSFENEYTSMHYYSYRINDRFIMYHFWIDLSK
jgi:hypothetical protein